MDSLIYKSPKQPNLLVYEVSMKIRNQSIFSNYLEDDIVKKANRIKIVFLDNKNTFNENDWKELYSLSKETFVDESEELKKIAAGAGLTDND